MKDLLICESLDPRTLQIHPWTVLLLSARNEGTSHQTWDGRYAMLCPETGPECRAEHSSAIIRYLRIGLRFWAMISPHVHLIIDHRRSRLYKTLPLSRWHCSLHGWISQQVGNNANRCTANARRTPASKIWKSQPALIATFVCPEGLRLSVALDRDLLPPHNLFYRSFDCLRDVGEKEATGSLGCRTYYLACKARFIPTQLEAMPIDAST